MCVHVVIISSYEFLLHVILPYCTSHLSSLFGIPHESPDKSVNPCRSWARCLTTYSAFNVRRTSYIRYVSN